MASSDLTLALLGGRMDPAYLPAYRRMSLGENFITEGTNASSAYPMQGLARVLQAGLGSYLMNSGLDQFKDAQTGRQTEDAATLSKMRGDTPAMSGLGAALAGPPPTAAPTPAVQGAMPDQAAAAPGIVGNDRNNPLNLRYAGQDGATNANGFAAFPTQQAGLAAADNQMGLYAQRGVNTLRGLISTWAPPNENDTEGYIKRVSATTGIDPDKQIDLTNPAVTGPIKAAMSAVENGAPKGQQYAQAGNVRTDAGTAPPPLQQGQQPATATGGPATGMQAPNVKAALDMMKRAQDVIADPRNQYRPNVLEAAKAQIEYAKTIMGLDTFTPGTQGGLPGQLNTRTNEFKPLVTAAPRFAQDQHGNTLVGLPGGGVQTMQNNPSGITGTTPDANAMRIIAEIGPKIINGTATAQEQATYATAADTYQKRTIHTEPSTQSLVSVPSQPLPPGMPQPGMPQGSQTAPQQPGDIGGKVTAPTQAQAVQHGPQVSDTGVQKLTPGGPPPAAVDKRYEDFHKLETTALGARDEIQQAQLLKQTLHEIGSTGPATPFLANLSRYAAQAGVPEETIKKFGLPNGATETQAAALANALVMEIARAGFPQRITNNDLQFAQSVKPNPAQPLPAADFLIDNTILPRAQRDIERYGSVVNLTNPQHGDYEPSLGSMPSKLFEFDKAHPLTSYTPKLSGGGASSGTSAQGVQPPVLGARQAPDGNFYVPDPARPGKYLQVR